MTGDLKSLPGVGGRWLSAHLHFTSPLRSRVADAIVREVVAPYLPGGAASFGLSRAFFIRYSLNGSHIRLRLLPGAAARHPAVKADVEARWRAFVRSASAATQCDPAIRWVPYVAEERRYGGPHALPIAERQFVDSSLFAVEQLAPDVCEDQTRRMGRAMLAMLTTWYVLLGDREAVRDAARTYVRDYLTLLFPKAEARATARLEFSRRAQRQSTGVAEFIRTGVEALEAGHPISPSAHEYRKRLVRRQHSLIRLMEADRLSVRGEPAQSWIDAARVLGASWVHMTNNRLGVNVPEETFLAFVLELALGGREELLDVG
jgi:thiopeptide-type bacteriocin biosynthesis protein